MMNQIPGQHDEAVMGEKLEDFNPSALTVLKSLFIPSAKMVMAYAVIMMEVIFPDVSFWQKIIDFVKMKAAGAMGVIIRAGQNLWVDSFWFENWAKAKAAGLPRGSYWFYDSRVDPREQARMWASLLVNDDGEMEHCLDLEENYGGAYKGWKHWYDFLIEFQRLTKLSNDRIAIYTSYYYWLEYGPNPVTESASNAWFGRYILWLAWWTSDPANVKIPKPWTFVGHWQKGTFAEGEKYGVQTKEIDLNHANMSKPEFVARYGGDTPPVEEVVMKVGTVVVEALNYRTGPGVGYADIGDLYKGDKVYGELDSVTNWIHFNRIVRAHNGADEAVTGWASAFTQYMTLADVVEIPEGKKLVNILHVFDDGSVEVKSA